MKKAQNHNSSVIYNTCFLIKEFNGLSNNKPRLLIGIKLQT